jgi:hypothetical protein
MPIRKGREKHYRKYTMNDQDINIDASETDSSGPTRDYRDNLRDLLDEANRDRGVSRYRICKQMGIDSGTLSNVLAKRRHFSLDKLDQILALLGYQMTFTRKVSEA